MRALAILVVTYLVLGLESPLLQRAEIELYAPNLALIAVLFTAWTLPGLDGLITAFGIGLLHDGFAMGPPVGMHTEIAVLLFLAARPAVRKLSLQGPVISMIATAVACLVSSLLFFGLTAIFDRQFSSYGLVFAVMVPNALVTAPFAPLLFPVYAWAVGRVTPRRSRQIYFS